jgi:hypothetical protein
MTEIAAYFPDVRCVPLDAPAAAWADAAQTAYGESSRRHNRDDAARAFEQTPFDMSRATDAYMALLELATGGEPTKTSPLQTWFGATDARV